MLHSPRTLCRSSSSLRAATLAKNRSVLLIGWLTLALGVGSGLCATVAAGQPPASKTEPAWVFTRFMSTQRVYHTATLLTDGRVLVAGGIGETGPSGAGPAVASAELYDPATAVWTATGAMASPRAGHVAFPLKSGKVLVLGGSAIFAEIYDPATGTWSAAASPAQSDRALFSAALLASGKVLIAGGYNYNIETIWSSAELYDPATDSWSSAGTLTTARYDGQAVALADGRVLLVGGHDDFGDEAFGPAPIADAEVYDPGSGKWTGTASLPVGRLGATETPLADGTVLLAGGDTGLFRPPGTEAEIYDPVGTWTATGPMSASRYGHTATRLPDGRVLAVGGITSANFTQNGTTYFRGESISGTERYEASSRSWTTAGSLTVSRAFHTATLLPDGSVLVTGGITVVSHDVIAPNVVTSLASAEIYQAGNRAPEAAFVVTGLFSDQAGLYQLIQLQELNGNDGQNHLAGTVFTVTSRAGVVKQFVFPYDLPSANTARRSILIKTESFALPDGWFDYVMRDGFLPTDGGTIEASGPGGWRATFPPLPADGHSMYEPSTATVQPFAIAQGFTGPQFHISIGTDPAIEYYNATLDHYFITASQPDLDALDSARTPGWSRTGQRFPVWISRYVDALRPAGQNPPPGLLNVCRLYIPPAEGDSHFFSASADECASTRAGHPEFQLETSAAFLATLPDPQTGACPAGQTPVYRVWNGRADSNHRYVTSTDIRNAMVDRGYIAEGYGPDRVAMCVGGGT
jgi:hypothetical protein